MYISEVLRARKHSGTRRQKLATGKRMKAMNDRYVDEIVDVIKQVRVTIWRTE